MNEAFLAVSAVIISVFVEVRWEEVKINVWHSSTVALFQVVKVYDACD